MTLVNTENLKSKSDAVLMSELKSLRQREKDLVAKLLKYLLEVEIRKLDLAQGYSDLYDFCQRALGYSKDEAYYRIAAMRLLKAIPEAEEKIKEGKLTLTTLAKTQAAFSQENKRRKAQGAPLLSLDDQLMVLEQMENKPSRQCEKTLATIFPVLNTPPEKTKPLDSTKTLIQFTVDEDTLQKLERLKNLLAHKNYNGSWEGLFKELAEVGLKALDPEKKPLKKNKPAARPLSNQTSTPSQPAKKPVPVVAPRKRRGSISVHLRRELLRKAHYQCQYINPHTQERCSSHHALELDHILPWALGGRDEANNLRVMCSRHNKFLAWKIFNERAKSKL